MKRSMRRRLGWACWLLLSASGLQALADAVVQVPLGLPLATQETSDAAERIALGRKLFFERRLSADGTISCGSCHDPDRAFSDARPVAQGIGGKTGTRNAPSLLNAGYNASQFWDGRRSSLESQVLDPLLNPHEHGLASLDALTVVLNADPAYRTAFAHAYSDIAGAIRPERIADALAAYVRSLRSGNAPADRYLFSGERTALSAAAAGGLALFRGRAQCATCHTLGDHDALYTDGQFHNLAVGFQQLAPKLASAAKRAAEAPRDAIDRLILTDPDVAALGRFNITLEISDLGKFKTPSLRNVALTAPYMHDGSIAKLEDAVDYEIYYRGQSMGRPLILTPSERQDLIEFLKALTSPAWTR